MADIQKYVETAKNLEFCDDFGKEPVLLAHLTKDASTIAVISLLSGFVAMAALGFPGLIAIAFAALNDISYARSHDDDSPTVKNGETTIDVQSSTEAIESVGLGSAASIASVLALPDEERPIDTTPIADIQQPSIAVPGFSQPSSIAVAPDYLARVRNVVKRNMLFFVCGSRGSGKGMAVANLLRWKLEQYPNAIVVAFDPKDDDKEAGYWDHPRIIRHAVDLTYSKRERWDEQLNDFIDTSHHYLAEADVVSGKHVFILIDEVLSIKKKASKNVYAEIEGLISTCVGMGSSKGQHVILVTQSFNAGDAGLSDELVQNMCLLGTFREDEFDRTAKIVKTGRASAIDFDRSAFSNLVRKSPVGRVLCLAGDFIPAPKLTNYSTWDRDTNTVINQPKTTTEQHTESAVFTATAGSESDRFQSMLTNATAKALQGDRDAVEAIRFATQFVEVGQKHQAIEALAKYA